MPKLDNVSVISDTLRPQDLIPAFIEKLQELGHNMDTIEEISSFLDNDPYLTGYIKVSDHGNITLFDREHNVVWGVV